jgi:hypothetical protein
VAVLETGPELVSPPLSDVQLALALIPWPPSFDFCKSMSKWDVPVQPQTLPLPLWETALPQPIAAAAARVWVMAVEAATIVLDYGIKNADMATVYMSPDPFFDAFEEDLDLRIWSFDKHRTAGLFLLLHNGCLYLGAA